MAKFEPGNPKPPNSGRKLGQPNKSTLPFKEKLEELGFDIATEATKLYLKADKNEGLQWKILELLATYSLPRIAPIAEKPEEPAEPEQPKVSEEELLKIAQSKDK